LRLPYLQELSFLQTPRCIIVVIIIAITADGNRLSVRVEGPEHLCFGLFSRL
jgi:hypothetical protein